MRAADLDRQARRRRRAAQLREEIASDYDVADCDLDRLDLAELFELRWKLLHRMMRPAYR